MIRIWNKYEQLNTPLKRKIFVGLSGGVDSAVSAALLKQAGARVTGVFIKGWYPPGIPCGWAAERRDAMRVAARLSIPFLTLDASEEYKKGVIEYLLDEYRAGRTPNPDVMCNREVKFGAFYRFMKAEGADAMATGHYRSGAKDQSYFLWAVPKEILETALFPVGDLEKERVRALAATFNLPVATKKDSQGVCFLGNVSVDEFLRSEFGTNPGVAVESSGRVVGEHDGALLSTLGQRVALRNAVEEGPWFVLSKDIKKNELRVEKRSTQKRISAPREIRFTDANWIQEAAQATEAQYRYRGEHVPGRVFNDRFIAAAPLSEPPAPGQSLVFYGANGLAGGGIIAA
ncbi:tRNA 2-thiouridine(34) synthase MnmA [Patescibacteria group bacterium]|nr:tRNA 2-thiouridine(34) synthase MnmA [Patescibacteria group bacterium]